MTMENPAYRAKFCCPREAWRDAWIRCGDIKVDYRHGMESGVAILCRLLKLAGKLDGDLFIQETGTKPEVARWRYEESIYHFVQYPVYQTELPIFLSEIFYESLEKLIHSPLEWSKISIKDELLGRDFIELRGKKAIVTDFGKKVLEARKAYKDKSKAPKLSQEIELEDAPEIISEKMYNSLLAIKENPQAWDELHHLTQRAFKKYSLVNSDNTLAESAFEAIDRYEKYIAENPPTEKVKRGPRKVFLTEQQAIAFDIIRKHPYRWLVDISTRTKNGMIGNGWVVEDEDGIPRLTEIGATIAKTGIRPTKNSAE